MAGGKLNARQKMINLMYLVFIAMMALNIDREVLRAFDDVNNSLVQTNDLTARNNTAFIDALNKTAETDETYQAAATNASAVDKAAQPLIGLIDKLKTALTEGEKKEGEDGELNYAVLSNLESVTKLFFVNDSKATPEGEELVKEIEKFNNFLKKVQSDTQSSDKPISTEPYIIDISDKKEKGEQSKSWLYRTFYGQPEIAAETVLTNLQNKVHNAETQIISQYLSNKVLDNVEINTFKAVISSPGFVTRGVTASTYAALGAFDNKFQGTAYVNGRSYPLQGGKADIPLETGSIGKKTLTGYMTFIDGKGKEQRADFEPTSYEVVDATIAKLEFMGVITADKMNVLYVGLDNPISATVSGVEPSSVKVSGPGVRSTGAGKGMVRPSRVGTINLTVSGTTNEGKSVSKSMPFRVKGLPRPSAVARGRTQLSLPPSSLANLKVDARMPEDFGFDLNVSVSGFKVKVPGRPAESISGNSLRSSSSIKSAKPGSTVTIFDIKSSSSAPVPNCDNNIVIEIL